jgi:hypothetical protein
MLGGFLTTEKDLHSLFVIVLSTGMTAKPVPFFARRVNSCSLKEVAGFKVGANRIGNTYLSQLPDNYYGAALTRLIGREIFCRHWVTKTSVARLEPGFLIP